MKLWFRIVPILLACLVLWGCDKTATGGDDEGSGASEDDGVEANGNDEGSGQDESDPLVDDSNDPLVDDSTDPPAPTPEDLAEVERGEYLVGVLLGCGNCHTPRDETGQPRMDMWLAGNACPPDAERCRNTPNLTNHDTGLAEYSDAELADLIYNGRRPDGTGISNMPSDAYHNLAEADQNAIVSYLRSVPGVDNAVEPRDPGPDGPAEPPIPVDISMVPTPAADSPDYESAMRGRYLVVSTGACLGCHTPEDENDVHDMTRALAGGHAFNLAQRGMSPPWPAEVVSANLTPDDTGIAGWTADDVVASLRQGVEPGGGGICPPMPSGPHGAYAGLTDEDATDIANYLLSLPPIVNEVAECELPDMGAMGSGEGSGE